MITALVTFLNAHVGYGALVGQRTYPTVLPQNATLPAVAYQMISRVPVHDRETPDTLVQTRWQFSINARKYSEILSVASALKTAVQAFTSSSPRVDRIFVEGERDTDQADIDENNYYRRVIDVIVVHEE